MRLQPPWIRALRLITILALLAALVPAAAWPGAASAAPAIFWYNGEADYVDGIRNGVDTKAGPRAIVFDNFVVPPGGIILTGVFSDNQLNVPGVTQALWEIRTGLSAGNGGTLVAYGTNPATETPTGRTVYGDVEYRIQVDGLNIALPGGTYWLGVAPVGPNTSVDYWISTTSGANAIGNPPGNDDSGYLDRPSNGADYISMGYNFALGVIAQLASPSLELTPDSDLSTNEAGGTDTFEVHLGSYPSSDVTVSFVSSDTGEGDVSPATLTFTPQNALTPQTVTVTGASDAIDDGDVAYTINATVSSADGDYNGLTGSVGVTNEDDDSAGFTVSPLTAAETNESGGTAQFEVVLTSQPTANVTIPVASLDTSEGTAAPTSLTFTTANWNTAQTVTVSGVNDFQVDDDQIYTVRFGAPTGADGIYSALAAKDVSLLNVDNDIPLILVFPSLGTTSEAGGTASFNMVLTSQPTADVTVGLSSGDTGEGTVSPSSIVFTATNWNIPHAITVTGVDDAVDDDDQPYSVITAAAVSADPLYNGKNPSNLSLTNIDDDGVGIVVSAISGSTTEAGGTATFTVKLASEPTASVTIPLASLDTGEGTLSSASLTFTAANWNTPQTVTVTGVDDDVADGDQSYSVAIQETSSGDPLYDEMNPGDVAVVNLDDDTPGVTVAPTSGLSTAETGTTATFTVVLDSEPTDDVTITLTSGDTGEGTVSPASLTFTVADWDTPQTVTVTGVDDAVDDGDQSFTVFTSAASSSDPNYNTMAVADVDLTNTDDDTADVVINAPNPLDTAEAGQSDSFTVVLASEPTADVTIDLSSDDTTEGEVSAASLIFTPANWDIAQTVTVNGVDDALDDGDVNYNLTVAAPSSTDPNYNGAPAATQLPAVNYDDDTAGVTLAPISGNTSEDLDTAAFTIVLDSEPTADVTIGLSSSNTAEGTVSPASLTFTAGDWDTPQTVTVTGVDDAVDDDDQAYTIVTGAASSADAKYSAMAVADVDLFNIDNDGAGVSVILQSAVSQGRGITDESGAIATYEVQLQSQPTADVTVPFGSSDTSEGTHSVDSLTFTSANWNVAQTVTVTGQNDQVDDGDIQYSLVVGTLASADANYNGDDPANHGLINIDDDTAAVAVSPTAGLTTTEAGATATFTVRLTSEPTADVTVELSSNDVSEGTVAPASLTFTAANWSVNQTVTVTGVNDDLDDGNLAYSIVTGATSADSGYDRIAVADVALTNTDDDTATVTITPTIGLVTTESGGSAAFTVSLGARPASNVVVTLTSNDLSEGTPTQSVLTFTSNDWATPQTATVQGNDDLVDDGDITYTIVTSLQSTDAAFAALNPNDVDLTNVDNDGVGVMIAPLTGLTTTEAGGTASFTVRLMSQPTANVTVSFSSSDTTEGTVSPAAVTFTPANWETPQTVTETGVDDWVKDGDVAYTIVTELDSADSLYAAVNPENVTVVNLDNDVPDVVVTPGSAMSTTEQGSKASFTMALRMQPSADVVVTFVSSDTSEGTVAPASLTFTAANWSSPQSVTITGVDDKLDDGDITYNIVTAYQTTDPLYGPLNPADIAMVNVDNDTIVYLPLITRSHTEIPDLTVTAVTYAGGVQVVIKNQGLGTVTSPFWVDFYINPRMSPTTVNETWELIAPRGIAWAISGVSLRPGESLTLRPGDRFYFPERSNPGGTLRRDDVVFVQVDSANTASPAKGGVAEIDELPGRTYNNILRSVVPSDTDISLAGTATTLTGGAAALPARPR